MEARAHQLLALGQSVWLDFIRRGHLVSGEFDALVRDAGVVGVTSNPTIFQQAIAKSSDYDAAIAAGIRSGLSGEPLFEALAIEDIQMACDRLMPLYERSQGLDGRVSLEVSPRLANDSDGTLAAARRLYAAVQRANVMIKIPATKAGLPAIASAIADGISINVTLIFTIARYREVMEAYLSGLERRAAAGGALGGIRSVASFFISRVDSKLDAAIDARLATLPAGSTERAELDALHGQAAVANARIAYAAYEEVFGSARFQALAAKGAHTQRPLWASTSTKNPTYRDVLYVEELIGADTVNTMPPATLTAFNDHGVVAARIQHDVAGSRKALDALRAHGIAVDALIDQLEDEGVKSFMKSYDELLDTLEAKRKDVVAQGARP